MPSASLNFREPTVPEARFPRTLTLGIPLNRDGQPLSSRRNCSIARGAATKVARIRFSCVHPYKNASPWEGIYTKASQGRSESSYRSGETILLDDGDKRSRWHNM